MGRFAIEPGAAGARVDQAVARFVPGLSVAAARRLLAAGAVRLDGRPARKGDRVREGQTLEVDDAQGAAEAPGGRRVTPDPAASLDVLAVDPDFVAVAKPAGMPSHPLAAGELGTVANGLVARFPECAAASLDAREGGLVHRLDTGTSGVLLAARHREAWTALRGALADPSCEKVYLAEARGTAGPGQSLEPIGRAGRRGARVRVGGGRNPLAAQTRWEPLEQRAETTLLRVTLSKGRAHQVRAHLAAAGHPIADDPLYASTELDFAQRSLRGNSQEPSQASGLIADESGPPLRLHAWRIRFRHPRDGQMISIEAPPPDWAKIGR